MNILSSLSICLRSKLQVVWLSLTCRQPAKGTSAAPYGHYTCSKRMSIQLVFLFALCLTANTELCLTRVPVLTAPADVCLPKCKSKRRLRWPKISESISKLVCFFLLMEALVSLTAFHPCHLSICAALTRHQRRLSSPIA